ncbi:permease, partial [Bacillus cereus]
MFKEKKFIHIHFSEKDGVNPIFYLFPFKTFQIVHIAIGLTQELTMYVIQSYAGGKMMGSLRLHIENKNRNQELRNICLYSIAKTVSLFGSSIYSFALGLYVLQITGSALNFAITLILGTIPMIVMNPFAGVIADKVDKKKLVVCMDVLSGCLLITVYILSNYYGLNLFIIYTT